MKLDTVGPRITNIRFTSNSVLRTQVATATSVPDAACTAVAPPAIVAASLPVLGSFEIYGHDEFT